MGGRWWAKIRQLHGLSLTFLTSSNLVQMTSFLYWQVTLRLIDRIAVSDILSIVWLLSNMQSFAIFEKFPGFVRTVLVRDYRPV
jgi:hypothetical protein